MLSEVQVEKEVKPFVRTTGRSTYEKKFGYFPCGREIVSIDLCCYIHKTKHRKVLDITVQVWQQLTRLSVVLLLPLRMITRFRRVEQHL